MSLNKQNLYYIALLTNKATAKAIRAFKLDFKMRFGASHALKSPAHITLQMPFKKSETFETFMTETLTRFCTDENPFNVELNGFDCFEPRVIFAKVENPKPIINLANRLEPIFRDTLKIEKHKFLKNIHPHCTVATRDLIEEMFFKAWKEYEKKKFKASFTVSSIALLKHNGQNWDVFREFKFGGRQ